MLGGEVQAAGTGGSQQCVLGGVALLHQRWARVSRRTTIARVMSGTVGHPEQEEWGVIVWV